MKYVLVNFRDVDFQVHEIVLLNTCLFFEAKFSKIIRKNTGCFAMWKCPFDDKFGEGMICRYGKKSKEC